MMSYEIAFSGLILTILFFASMEDIKYRWIRKRYVLSIFILVLLYINLFSTPNVEGTICFLLAFFMFSGIVLLSKGGFGFGDAVILSALGFYIGDLVHLKTYFIIMTFTMMVIGAVLILYNRIKHNVPIKKQFKFIRTLSIDKVKPGMILANDYFMTGLTENDIKKLKKEGYITLDVKQAYPFIPIIMISFLIYVLISL